MKIGKMVNILYQWIIAWLVLLLFVKGYMYILRTIN